MPYYVSILASQKNGTLYIGTTNDLVCRVWKHKQKVVDGFTKRYSVQHLVYSKPMMKLGSLSSASER